MESTTIHVMIQQLCQLNPKYSFRQYVDEFNGTFDVIITNAKESEFNSLVYPKGYYWNLKNGVTNKHIVERGAYESFILLNENEI